MDVRWAEHTRLSAAQLRPSVAKIKVKKGKVDKNGGPIFGVCGPTFTKFWNTDQNPLLFAVPFPDYLFRVSFR